MRPELRLSDDFSMSKQKSSELDHKAIYEEMLQGSDFACALLGASVLDVMLRDVLIRHFKRTDTQLIEALFNRAGAPLSSLSHKINFAEASGLISQKDAETLHKLRKIRNEFAHRAERLTFDHNEISNITRDLGVDASFTSRAKYTRATLGCITNLAHVSIRQIERQQTLARARHKRKMDALDRREKRGIAEIHRAHSLAERLVQGPPLTPSERAQLRRLERKMDRLYPDTETESMKGN
jgi:DNA-binding MltR family transcriptional regulator